jgi:hypothetical protein
MSKILDDLKAIRELDGVKGDKDMEEAIDVSLKLQARVEGLEEGLTLIRACVNQDFQGAALGHIEDLIGRG